MLIQGEAASFLPCAPSTKQSMAPRTSSIGTRWWPNMAGVDKFLERQKCEHNLFPKVYQVTHIKPSILHSRHLNETSREDSNLAFLRQFTSLNLSSLSAKVIVMITWYICAGCIFKTTWCYVPIPIKENMTAWDLLKANSPSHFKWEKSAQTTLIKSITFRRQESDHEELFTSLSAFTT